MKNISHIAATIVIFAFLVLSIILNVKQFSKAEEKDARIEELVNEPAKNTVKETYVKDSVTHTVFNEKIIENTAAEKQLALGKTYADSLQKALKISIAKIDQATKINALLEARLALKESEPIAGKRVLSHKDKNLSLDYYPETDSVKLAMDIGLNEVRYKKKKWLLGKEQNFVELFPDDERIKIKGLKSFTIKEKTQKRFGIGVSSGYGVSAQNGVLKTTPYVGFGINYNLFEF